MSPALGGAWSEDSLVLPTGEVTLLFSDIEGSTRLLHALGDVYGEVLAAHHELLRGVWERHGGVEVHTAGDGFFVAFPLASEAIAAAAGAQSLIAAAPELKGLRVRIGVHTGAPRIRDRDYWGADVHYAARLCSAASGGQVLLSASTQGLVAVEVEDLGEHALKDFPAPRRIFHLPINGRDSSAFPPVRTLRTGQTNLPDQISSFIGREQELLVLRQLIPESRMVSLVGAGGVGKTRLALRLGADLLDGSGDEVWLVELAPLTDAALVGSTVAHVLRLSERAGRPMLETLAGAIADRKMLIILDNCEHVLGAAAALAAHVLKRCPRLLLLATSRQPLGIDGEQVYRVPSLSIPHTEDRDVDAVGRSDAVRLFVERARQQRPDFALSDQNAETVARVCRRLDGIALAIELAAVRLRSLSTQQLDARLDQRFRLLKAGERGAKPPRQQTLEALIDWSYQLLSKPEQELLARLAVFAASGFDLSAAETVSAREGFDELDPLDHLDALVDKSLVQAEDSAGEVRYRLLETVRAYATSRLEASGEAKEMRRRHAHWFLGVLQPQAAWFASHDPLRATRLLVEQENFRTALEWAADNGQDETVAWLAVQVSQWIWLRQGQLNEAARWLGFGLERRSEYPPLLQARVLGASSSLARARGNHDQGAQLCEQALSIYRELGHPEGICSGLSGRNMFAADRGDLAGARAALEEAILCARANDLPGFLPTALCNLGDVAIEEGRLEEARRSCEEGLTLADSLATTEAKAVLLINLMHIANLENRFVDAIKLGREALTVALDDEDQRTAAGVLMEIAWSLAVRAQPARAARLLGVALGFLQRTGTSPERTERVCEHRTREALLERLDAAYTQALLDEGRKIPLKQAIRDMLSQKKDQLPLAPTPDGDHAAHPDECGASGVTEDRPRLR